MQDRKKVLVDTFRQKCFDTINESKAKYLNNMGEKLKNSKLNPKAYWKINSLINVMSLESHLSCQTTNVLRIIELRLYYLMSIS